MDVNPSDEQARLIALHAPIPVLLTKSNGEVVFQNDASRIYFADLDQLKSLGLSEHDLHRLGLAEPRELDTDAGTRFMRIQAQFITDAALWLIVLIDVDDLRRQNAELRELLHTDPLTHVASRRRLFDEGERMLADHKRHGTELAVAIADLDNFKTVNDKCGHLIGDHVLAFIAEVIRDRLRRNDLIGRIGGDEFAILMPYTGAQEAKTTCLRLIADVAHELKISPPARVLPSLSIGLSIANSSDSEFQGLLDRADQALLAGKRQGRGVVVLVD